MYAALGDVHKFGGACENLLAGIRILRPLGEDEVLFIKHYCNELLGKIQPLSPITQEPAPPTSSPVTS